MAVLVSKMMLPKPDVLLNEQATMKLQHIIYHLSAMVIAYGIVLVLPMLFDYVFDTCTEIVVIVWLNIGLLVMRVRKIPFPSPDMHHVDVKGGLKVLWWAIFWPNYMR